MHLKTRDPRREHDTASNAHTPLVLAHSSGQWYGQGADSANMIRALPDQSKPAVHYSASWVWWRLFMEQYARLWDYFERFDATRDRAGELSFKLLLEMQRYLERHPTDLSHATAKMWLRVRPRVHDARRQQRRNDARVRPLDHVNPEQWAVDADPSAAICHGDLLARVHADYAAIRNDRLGEAMQMRLDGAEWHTVAAHLGVCESTAKARLARLLARLTIAMQERGHEDTALEHLPEEFPGEELLADTVARRWAKDTSSPAAIAKVVEIPVKKAQSMVKRLTAFFVKRL